MMSSAHAYQLKTKWRPSEWVEDCLHEILRQEMSRLADYFAVVGIDKGNENG